MVHTIQKLEKEIQTEKNICKEKFGKPRNEKTTVNYTNSCNMQHFIKRKNLNFSWINAYENKAKLLIMYKKKKITTKN